jgi:hypothetical protein
MKEIYKDIEGYNGMYQVSNLGNVKSLKFKNEKKLKNYLGGTGYYKVSLCKDFKAKTFNVHRLMCIAFVPNLENKPQVNHINGIKTDNRVENLEWCTIKENIQHAHDNGLVNTSKGEDRNFAKLKEKQIIEIRKIGKSKTQLEISKIYNVHQSLISCILSNKIWKHI